MKKSFAIIALAALVMLAGCKKNDPKPNGTRLIAGIEKHKSDSKTSLDGTIIKWSESDKLYVNNGTTPATFTLVSGTGTTTGEFATNGDYTFANENNLAVYPYNDNITVSGTTVTMTLPAVQTASGAGSFGNGANPMMGTFSDMDNLTLTSLCGVLCLQLTGNAAITAIEIVGGPDDKLNGTFTVDYMNPVLTYSANGTNTVRLNCEATLTSTAQKFYVVVPAGTLHGFTMKVYDDNNVIFSKSTANEVPVFVNTLSTMTPVEANPYAVPLTLEALSDGTIVVYDPESGMQYSKNGEAKTTMSGTTQIDVNTGDKVAFYGNGTSIASYKDTMITGGTADVKVYGNIMSLVDEENFATATTLPETDYTFYRLFNNYDHLTDASGLLLPATTLASANTHCYAEMFSNSDNLVAGPSELPATTLSYRCYQAMFSYCPSLTVAPILPATTLEGYCYYQMFKVCTSLTEAPVLPAPELTSNCYREMFSGCSSLNSITCLATSVINSSNSTSSWVNGVASSGTFTKASGANVSTTISGSGSTWPRGNKGIPEGWTPVNYGAVLVENITLNKTETTLTVGETETLSVASVLPATATDPTVTWSSNNTGVATVVATTGEVTAVAAGTATITATANDGSNVTATCAVTVNAPAPVIPAGAINSLFTINADGDQVYFSQGNLQATTSDLGANWTWAFATNQWDYIGDAAANNAINGNGTVSTNGTVDLFGWSTAVTYYGIYNSVSNADYSGDFVDWGGLTIGGAAPGTWRTLTKDEWVYLFNVRPGIRFAKATVNDICGVIILPDNWDSGIYTLNDANVSNYSNYNKNIISEADWNNSFEPNGAVFLPAAGYRGTLGMNSVNSNGSYWASTEYGPEYANRVSFSSTFLGPSGYNQRYYGSSVRLVSNAN